MAAEETEWVTFFSGSDTDDGNESLSFSNLPISDKPTTITSPSKDEHFEFQTLGNSGDTPSPELLFSNGQLLPHNQTQPIFRSISSSSITLDNSSSSNSNSSSCVISRSVSSSSSDARPRRRRSSSAFYAYPSPSPRVTPVRRSGFGSGGGSGRRSTGTAPPAGWGLLRLGVVMAPEMELRDIRFRGSGKLMRGGCVMEEKSTVWRLLGGGLTGCSCSPEDVVVGKKKKKKKKKGEERGGVGSMRERKERMFEWLDELSLGKEPLIG